MTPNPRVSKYSDSADERSITLVSRVLTLPTHRQTPSLTSTPGRPILRPDEMHEAYCATRGPRLPPF